ncbi:MAG: class I SAM-dependent methyltransferase [Clostridia bacterium]
MPPESSREYDSRGTVLSHRFFGEVHPKYLEEGGYMFWQKPALMNRRAMNPRFKLPDVIEALEIDRGDVVADIGSGGGIYSIHFSRAVGEGGRVYAVERDSRCREYIAAEIARLGLKNVLVCCPELEDPGLPVGSCDLVFMRNVLHHIRQPARYFLNVRRCLRNGGRVAIIDYSRRSLVNAVSLLGHCVARESIDAAMGTAGYTISAEHEFLPDQHFLVYEIDEKRDCGDPAMP